MKAWWLLVLLMQSVDVKSGHPYHKGCLIYRAVQAEEGGKVTRDRKVADGFIEVVTVGRTEKTAVRVSAIERYRAQGDNTLLFFTGGAELEVSENYTEIDRMIQEASGGVVR